MNTITEKSNILNVIEKVFVQQGLESNQQARRALDLFLSKGLPTIKSEEYRFIPITRLLEKAFTQDTLTLSEPDNQLAVQPTNLQMCNKVAFVNGKYAPERSEILDSSILLTIDQPLPASDGQDPFDLLNQAFCDSFVHIQIPEHTILKQPLAIIYYFDSSTFVFANPRWKCTVGTHSSLTISENTVASEGSSFFNNKQSRVVVGEHSEVEFVTIQNGSVNEIQVNNSFTDLASNSKLHSYAFTFRGQLVRNNLTVAIQGENTDARLHGLYLLSGNSIADNHTVVDHCKPRSYSNEIYKGIMDGKSKAVFNGKIFVRPDAQKTNAFQTNRNILLSESASIHTKPQLEIWADDVKCSHGCTTGQLDEEALFYLRSRGLSKDMAKGMLLYAFAAETLEGLKDESVRNFINQLILEQLHQTV